MSDAHETSKPTREFLARFDVEAPQIDGHARRPGWLVHTRLRALLDRGRIDREAFDSALTWRRYAETITPSHTQSWDLRVDTSFVPSDAGMLRRVKAAGWIRACTAALGPLRLKLLELCVRDDKRWVEVAALLRVSPSTAVNYTVEAIEALADFAAGRTVAPPRVLRSLTGSNSPGLILKAAGRP